MYNKLIVTGRQKMVEYMMNHLDLNRRYIIQQRIPLASINKSPYDIRVMVQRARNSTQWEVTGMAAKVAVAGFVITNAAGDVMKVEEAIVRSALGSNVEKIIDEINRLSVLAARQLQAHYSRNLMFGLDVGLDIGGKVWIIEANMRPSMALFHRLEDKSILQNILDFTKENKD